MNPVRIVASGGVLPLTFPGSHDDTVVPADIVPVVALTAMIGEVSVVKLIPETLLSAETLIMGRFGLDPQPAPRPVGRGRSRAIGFPTWPIMIDPDNTEHALNLVADIEWAKKVVKFQTKKVRDRFQEFTQMLSTTAPHFVPTLLEELARIFDDSGFQKLAMRAFNKARKFERTYGLPIDPDRHRQVFTEFTRRGIVSPKEMVFEATSCIQRFSDPEDAYQYFLEIITNQVGAGIPPYVGLPRDLIRVAKPTGRTPQQVGEELLDNICGLSGMRRAPAGFAKALSKRMVGLLDHRPYAVTQLFFAPPGDCRSWRSPYQLEEWVTDFISIGGPTILQEDPMHFRRWLLNVLDALVGRSNHSFSLFNLIVSNKDVISAIELNETYLDLPLEFIGALTVAGVQWRLDNASPKENDQLNSFFYRVLYHWHPQYREALYCLKVPQIRAHILCGWTLEKLMKDEKDAIARADAGLLYDEFLNNECQHLNTALFSVIDRFVTSFTLAAEAKLPLGNLERLVEKANVDAATVLATNLAHGLITELIWPELERHIHAMRGELSPERGIGPRLQITESYPGVVAFCGTKVVVVAGDTTLLDTKISTPYVPFDMVAVSDAVGDQVLAFSCSGVYDVAATWDDGYSVSILFNGESYLFDKPKPRYSSLATPDGRVVGDILLRPTDREFNRTNSVVYGDNAGTIWCSGGEGYGDEWRNTIFQYDPVTGIYTINQPPQQVVDLAEATDITIDWVWTTFLPASVDNDAARAKIIPVIDTGEFCCVAGRTKDEKQDYSLVAGDGTRYIYDAPVCGVTTFGGVTCLVGVEESGTALYLPGVSATYGKLATILDDRGEPHWMYQLPWVAWGNLTLRDEEASRRLRAVRPADVAPLLAALEPETGKSDTTVDQENNIPDGKCMYAPLSFNCQPGSAAMKAAADLLGTDDRELCVSVVQLALSAQASVDKLTEVLDQVRGQHEHGAVATHHSTATRKNFYPDHSACSTYAVIAKVQQLKEVIDGAIDVFYIKNGVRQSYSWTWFVFVGREKALVSWAMGPLTSPAARMEAAALLRELADAKIDNRTWRQVWVDWSRMSAEPDDARVGLSFTDANTQVVVLDRLYRNNYRLIVAGNEFPETVCGAPTFGVAKTSYDLGVEPGMSAEEMRVWADKLERMGDIDPGEWLSRMRPLIDALTTRTFLTETAAIMLIVGGIYASFTRVGGVDIAAFCSCHADYNERWAAEYERRKTISRKLKFTEKSTQAATALLSQVGYIDEELLTIAAFDNNPVLIDAFVASIPDCDVIVPDQLMEKYFAKQWRAPEVQIRLLFQLICRLEPNPHFHFSGWDSGMAASIALDLAINLPAQGFADDAEAREVCSFLVHQLTMLKTTTDKAVAQHFTTLPLTGDISGVKDDRDAMHYWGYIDAFRGLMEGHFDKIIADLEDETKHRPVGCYRDPRVSAPVVVAEVCRELGLTEPAAVYFLQLLALVDPTDSNVKAWNGWKKKQFDEARAELIAHDLVVEGKRTGAGRTVFLPGAWWEARSGSMPVEAWKSNFYLIRYRERCENTVRWCPPTEPFDQLFQTVWGRWLAGDRPSFDVLTTKKYRR